LTIKVRISPFLQEFTENCEVVQVEGRTVEECLENLEARFPGIKSQLGRYDDMKFKLFADVSIDVTSRSLHPDELATVLHEGDELTISVTAFGG
jgi:molybdopterin synthase sulfur carrier subunit